MCTILIYGTICDCTEWYQSLYVFSIEYCSYDEVCLLKSCDPALVTNVVPTYSVWEVWKFYIISHYLIMLLSIFIIVCESRAAEGLVSYTNMRECVFKKWMGSSSPLCRHHVYFVKHIADEVNIVIMCCSRVEQHAPGCTCHI